MQRVLVIADSKFFRKVLTTRVEELGMAVDTAEDFAELQQRVEGYEQGTYFLALCDLNIPGAQDSEAVELLARLGIPTIVFTGSFDDAVRQKILKMRVIDYVVNSSPKSIDCLVRTIVGLRFNGQVKIMVV